MADRIQLESLLSHWPDKRQRGTLFALIGLGVVESLTSGSMDASEAVEVFFHADNCLFVRDGLADKVADEIMSRGVQLPDLFEALPTEQATQAYQQELTAIHALCLQLVERKRQAA